MIIGVVKEIKTDEYRVALTPAGARELTDAGHRVLVERGAGVGSSIADEDYAANGATLVDDVDDVWADSELLLKVKEPIAAEYHRLGAHRNQVLFTYLHLAASRECTDALVSANNVAIAYETVRLRDNSLPLLTPMSEVAGRMAPMMGAHHLMRAGGGHGTLISGVPGVAPANVVVIGAGVAGFAAATMAAGLHANVQILDRNLERLRQVDIHFDGRVADHRVVDAGHRRGLPAGRHRDRGGARRRREGAEVGQQRPGGADARTARSWWTSRSTRAAASRRRDRRRTRTPSLTSTGRSSTAWRTCPARCPRRRPSALSNATLPYVLELARLAGATRSGPTRRSARASTSSTAKSPTDRSPSRSADLHAARSIV